MGIIHRNMMFSCSFMSMDTWKHTESMNNIFLQSHKNAKIVKIFEINPLYSIRTSLMTCDVWKMRASQ